jgi:molecular chaperone DnaJ
VNLSASPWRKGGRDDDGVARRGNNMAKKKTRDYYEVLDVPRNADERAIKQAYRKLARLYHPDVTGDDGPATERFREITQAYETLSDPKRRRSYDLFGAPGQQGAVDGFGLDDALAQIRSIFTRDKSGPRPGVDVEVDVTVTFAEAFTGAKKDVKVVLDRPCKTCGGSGKVTGERCKTCRGQGARLTDDTLVVTIPRGIADLSRLRLKGRGPVGEHQGPPGDLYVVVHVSPDRRFERDGDTLLTEVWVKASTALLGGTTDVGLPDETHVTMTVPAGTQGGQVFRLREQGFAGPGKSGRGDVLVTLHIALPKKLSDEERVLIEKVRDSLAGF